MAELFVNDPGTSLASSVATGDSTISVLSATGFPGSGNFRIRIDTELMLVTGVSGTTWTVTRNIEETTLAAHSSGASVNAVLTAAGLTALLNAAEVVAYLTTLAVVSSYVAKTANYSPSTSTDYTIDCTANSFTVTLPTSVGLNGKIYNIKNSGTGVITVATTSSQTIDGQLTWTLSTQYSNITVQSNGTNWIIL